MQITITPQNIIRCPSCANAIGRLRSIRTGRWYVVSLTSPITATGVEAQTNALHRCPRISDIEALPPYYAVPNRALRPVAAPAPASSPNVLRDLDHFPTPAPAIPAHTAAVNIESMIQSRGISRPMTREALLDLRKGIVAALDVFAVAVARYEVEVNGASVDTATASYWHQMRSIINAQIDGVQSAYKVIAAINRGEISGEIRTDASGYAAHHCDGCGIPVPHPGFCSACVDAMPTSTEDLPSLDSPAPAPLDAVMTMGEYLDEVVADAANGTIDVILPEDMEDEEVVTSRVANGTSLLDSVIAASTRPAGASDWPSDEDVPF